MQELSLDRCLYLFEDCRFDVFLHAAGTYTYYCFYFVYLSLFEVLVFDCYSLNVFSQQLLKTRVFRAILFCVTPLRRRAILGTDLCGVLRAALGLGTLYTTGPRVPHCLDWDWLLFLQ